MPNVDQIFSQNRLIRVMNDYFLANGYGLELDKRGICHGLATLYAKYVLEGR